MVMKDYYTRLKTWFAKNDRYAAQGKIELLEVCEGRAKAQVRICEQHLNGVDVAHGGVLFSLGDVVFGAAANSLGRVAVTLNAEISFFKPATEGMLVTAQSEVLSIHHTVATFLVSIRDEEGVLLATMKAQAYRKKEKVEV